MIFISVTEQMKFSATDNRAACAQAKFALADWPNSGENELKNIFRIYILVRFIPTSMRRSQVPVKKKEFDFEKALTELEQLVEKMEQGNLSLETSLQLFERGIALTRACQKALTEAEQKVQVLIRESGKEKLAEFENQEQK